MGKYCLTHARILAKRIDDEMAILLKPKPWYIPQWLYERLINKLVEVTQVKN